jgi:glycosyltransferase involved in cell wall biosynthesis
MTLRIAMVTTFYPPLNFGGDGQYVRRLAHALAARGCEVEVIHDADAWRVVGGKKGTLPPVEPEPPGVTVHRLESRNPLVSTLLTQQLGKPVTHGAEIRRLLSRDFDVIHFHNVSLVGGPGVLPLGDAIKLYTAHEHWLVCPNHVLWRHNKELCVGRECLKCSIAFKRPPQLWRQTDLLERSVEHVDAFIALSRSVAENHRAFGFQTPMTELASFLPDSEVKRPKVKPPKRAGRPYFLFVGRLEVIKGLQDVIPLFDDSLPADLVIAGAGNYEAELRAIAGNRPSVKFLGHVDPAALPALYQGSRGLIASSLCYEVFPMVALEAFRDSVPIVARRLGPYPQIVEESGGGLLFGDEAELREALFALVQNDTLRRELGAAGRRAVETHWSEETAMAGYFALIHRLAVARGRPQVAAKIDDFAKNAACAPRHAGVS